DRVDAHTLLSEKNIYVMPHAPPDLKPVAGIATVSEGNLVSHVQLLSRNLGIPNAILSEADLNLLKAYSGQTVFYAVSPGGTVIMKPSAAMTVEEKNLVETRRRSDERIAVPLDRIDLTPVAPIPLSRLKASDSGRWCGPKAANLGQLKHDFPEHVVDGFVIPFGAFRQHMDEAMPGTGSSYWHFLQQTFDAGDGESSGQDDRDAIILARLSDLREAIGRMAFSPAFETAVRDGFRFHLGADMGTLPVFVRSDTNMEDLKDFTGAGLNLTVFNVRDEARIFQAIREVWASAYTERSYHWRHRFLTNPENIYPSILVIPTVDVAKSGVMITTGVTGGHPDDITVAFSRGAGGAVEGQIAETWRLTPDDRVLLLSPARDPFFTVLPKSGGVSKAITSFETPLLDEAELDQLRRMAATVKRRLAENSEIGSSGPWDIELGFRDGRIWLFQIRPFVEHKQARTSAYLNQIDRAVPENRNIPLGWILP
ncbi:PEP/pyruvate-binding domain-containing protein, partial [Desulfosarcina sp.]|uniref:PEP/pyruvate-binding domain-containing protein n=1 Tax=Desulfosarcina sp. TaxID=2027861 RepID=UPI003566304C